MKKIILCFLFLGFLAFGAPQAQANTWLNKAQQGGLNQIGSSVYGKSDPGNISVYIAGILKALLGFLGIIFLALLVWAGFKYMFARSNEEKVTEALTQIRHAIIGLIIIALAWAIVALVDKAINKGSATSPGAGSTGSTHPSGS